MKIVKRSEWGARQPENVTLRRAWKGVVVHWFGSPRGSKKHAGCPALLRSVQRSHQAGEFSDIAYNMAVCPHGTVYELRGLRVQTGANGTTQTNREYGSVVVMIGKGDRFTDEAKVALRLTLAHMRNQPNVGSQVRCHGEITGSECPGAEITRWVKEKRFTQRPPIVNTPLDEAIMLLEASSAFRDRHPRIVAALAKLRSLRKKK
jgi:hypothetical protein